MDITWPRALTFALAVGFLGFAVATFVQRDRPTAADSVDVGFLQDMHVHHDQALVMAQLQLVDGEDPEILKLAREILITQSWELGRMDQMLVDRGHSSAERTDPDQAMAWMGMAVPLEAMPGLVSEDDIERLTEAEGAESDELFLELMAEHHVGAVHMAEDAATSAESREVREFASLMAHNQAQEINEFVLFSDRLGFDVDIDPVPVPELGDDGLLAD
jgi:uncharacterized protein (DUF305 family)